MSSLFHFLGRLKNEGLEFALSYKENQRICVSIEAGSEHWLVEFDETGDHSIEVFRQALTNYEPNSANLDLLFNRVQRAWHQCANDLGIEMVGDYQFRNTKGERFEATVFLAEFGSSKGALLFLPNAASTAIDAAHDCGYYVSLMSLSAFDHYNRAHFIETLEDFTWSNTTKNAPSWYTKQSP